MKTLLPPPQGMRFQELGDRLVVHFRPRRWGSVAFMTFWLLGWSAFGVVFSQLEDAAISFVVVWLVGWVIGEVAVGGFLVWLIFGQESLTVSPTQFEFRQKLWRFERARVYDIHRVHAVQAGRVPTAEDEADRDDFCLLVTYGEKKLAIGSGMDGAEAELVASSVRARMRPRGRWDDEASADPRTRDSRDKAGSAVGLISLLVVVAAVGILSAVDKDPELTRQTHLGRFSDPADYAAAETLAVLNMPGTKVSARPKCDEGSSWTHWTCRVKARVEVGSLAGQTVTYRCSPTDRNLDGSRFSSPTVVCRPDEEL